MKQSPDQFNDFPTEYTTVALLWERPSEVCSYLAKHQLGKNLFADPAVDLVIKAAQAAFAASKSKLSGIQIETRIRDLVTSGALTTEDSYRLSADALGDSGVGLADLPDLLERLQTFQAARKTSAVLTKASELLSQRPTEANQIIAAASGKLLTISQEHDRTISNPVDHLARWRDLPKEILSSGLAVMDDALSGGYRPGLLYLYAAPTGNGKTTWGIHTSAHALATGSPVLYFSPEEPGHRISIKVGTNIAASLLDRHERPLSWKEFGDRYLYLYTSATGDPLTPRDARDQAVIEALAIHNERFRIIDCEIQVEQIAQQMQLFALEFGSIPLVIIDHIHRLDISPYLQSKGNLNQAYKDAIYALDVLAKKFQTAMVIMGQVSQELEREWKKSQNVASLSFKESGEILQAASKAFIFGRHPTTPNGTIFRLKKDRIDGREANFLLIYKPEICRYLETGSTVDD